MAGKRASQPKKSVWLTPQPTRGRRGTERGSGAGNLDREKIVATAVRLAAPYPPVPPAMMAKLKSTNAGVPILAQFNYIVSTSYGTLLQ